MYWEWWQNWDSQVFDSSGRTGKTGNVQLFNSTLSFAYEAFTSDPQIFHLILSSFLPGVLVFGFDAAQKLLKERIFVTPPTCLDMTQIYLTL